MTAYQMQVPRVNIDSLTGLRFIAALSIALGHTAPAFGILTFIGMPLFFTLSGFVIHYVYSQDFAGSWKGALPEFAIARFSRIYPLYFFLFLFALISTPLGSYLTHGRHGWLFLPYLSFFYTWWPFMADGKLLGDWHYGISWSIPTEMFFYFAYALGLYKIHKLKTFNGCLAVLIGFCVLGYAWFYILFVSRDAWEPAILSLNSHWIARTQDFNDSFYRWFLYESPYSRIFEFTGGCLTCQLFLLARKRPPLPRGFLESLSWGSVAIVTAILVYLSTAGYSEPWLAVDNHSWRAFMINLHMNFLLAPFCYILFFAFAVGATSLGRILGSPVPRFFGDISYSIYLGHPLAIGFAGTLFGIGTFVGDSVIIGVILLLAWGLYETVEVPCKKWLRTALAKFATTWSAGQPLPALIGLSKSPR